MGVTWNEDHLAGIAQIALQLRRIADVLDELYGEALAGGATARFKDIFGEMLDRAERHFTVEAHCLRAGKLLRQTPARLSHELGRYRRCVADIERQLDSGAQGVLLQTVKDFGRWWDEHMCDTVPSLNGDAAERSAA